MAAFTGKKIFLLREWWGTGTSAWSGCGFPIPGDAQGQVEWGLEQPDPVGGNQPMAGGWNWVFGSLGSLPTQAILCRPYPLRFYDLQRVRKVVDGIHPLVCLPVGHILVRSFRFGSSMLFCRIQQKSLWVIGAGIHKITSKANLKNERSTYSAPEWKLVAEALDWKKKVM